MRHYAFFPILLLSISMLTGCGSQKFSSLEEEFVYTSLSFSPVSASAAGLHEYKGVNFNQRLDDLSGPSLDGQRHFYKNFRDRLNKLKRESLEPQDQADFDIIQDQISLSLLDLDTIQSAFHNPTLYVES